MSFFSGIALILVAGGKGSRMGMDTPKQFIQVNDSPIIVHTLNSFKKHVLMENVVVVLPEDYVSYWNDIVDEYQWLSSCKYCVGGSTRFHSVKNGLEKLTENNVTAIAVHDAARPMVSERTIESIFAAALERESVVPVVPISSSLRKRKENGGSESVDRVDYFEVQTPQCFPKDLLINAYNQPFQQVFTDDASVVEEIGGNIVMKEGNRENIKITTPFDLAIFNYYLSKQPSEESL